jgi:hypothetical protein
MDKITQYKFQEEYKRETWELNLAPITFLTGTITPGKSSVGFNVAR